MTSQLLAALLMLAGAAGVGAHGLRAAREGVTATSAGNAWAVGQNKKGQILILHWNGSSWRQSAAG